MHGVDSRPELAQKRANGVVPASVSTLSRNMCSMLPAGDMKRVVRDDAADRGFHIRYRIAGDGSEREKLVYLRHSLGLEEEIELLGWQSQAEVEAHLGWADAFLLTSLSEGISNSALEAMAAGVPVVSTRCGGMAEVVSGPDAGVLVDVGDVTQIAEALRSLGDPTRRSALAVGGAAVAQADFDLDRQAHAFTSAYRRLLAGDGRP